MRSGVISRVQIDMAELNQSLYNASLEALQQQGVPQHLADAASRVVATDDATQANLGRNEADTEVCKRVVEIINSQN